MCESRLVLDPRPCRRQDEVADANVTDDHGCQKQPIAASVAPNDEIHWIDSGTSWDGAYAITSGKSKRGVGAWRNRVNKRTCVPLLECREPSLRSCGLMYQKKRDYAKSARHKLLF